MYLLSLFLTFFSFFFTFFFGKFLGNYKNYLISIIIIIIATINSYLIFLEVSLLSLPCYIKLFNWIVFDIINIYWSFIYDSLTVCMLLIIMTISLCAHIYSISYMENDPYIIRFISYLSLFTFFMLVLVTSNNFIQLFIGWEGVGICSYLLINYWCTRIGANKSSLMAVFTNKISDIFLLFSFSIIFKYFKSLDFDIIFNLISINNPEFLYYSGLFIIIGSVGKSAQVGLHFWLPEAMEGPTPVSSLIHAATMVTAGIFLIIRCSFIFELIPSLLIWISFFGSITTFFGSTVGLFQYDIKKIIAYSTCSQLGYMFLSCGLSSYHNSIFHLMNHAFFKALLFLTAGYIIHSLSNEQDFRKMGGLLKLQPLSSIMLLIGSLSLMGFPFTSGFFSKEKIIILFYNKFVIEFFYIKYIYLLYFFQLISIISLIFTISYSLKMYIYIYMRSFNGYKKYIHQIHYGSTYIIFPLIFLSYLSIFSSYLLNDLIIGIGTDFWKSAIFISTNNFNNNEYYLLNFEFIKYIRQIPLIFTLYFIIFFFILYIYINNFFIYLKIESQWINNIFLLLNRKYLFFSKNIIYPIINWINNISLYYMFKLFDKGLIEFFGPYNISKNIIHLTKIYRILQTGLIYHYSGFIILGIILFILLIT
jgi:NADH-ubiquinone oxidoreductase chain 5